MEISNTRSAGLQFNKIFKVVFLFMTHLIQQVKMTLKGLLKPIQRLSELDNLSASLSLTTTMLNKEVQFQDAWVHLKNGKVQPKIPKVFSLLSKNT